MDSEGNREDVYHFSSVESGILYPGRINIEMTDTGEGIEDSSIGMNFITDMFGEELKPWQENENQETEQ